MKLLRALVIVPNSRTKELGSILQIARVEARKREHGTKNPKVRSIVFVPELGVYVAVYETRDVQKPKACGQRGVSTKR